MGRGIFMRPSAPLAAMTVASTSTAPGSSTAAAPTWLLGDLHHRVGQAAAASGMSVEAICEQWVREGLEHFEAHQAAGDPDGSGRCSLRTGTCSLGPIPLPVQQ